MMAVSIAIVPAEFLASKIPLSPIGVQLTAGIATMTKMLRSVISTKTAASARNTDAVERETATRQSSVT